MKILLVSFSERLDLINFFSDDRLNDYYLLDYSEKPTAIGNNFLKGIEKLSSHKKISSWVQTLNPSRIIFFENSDIRLVFLNIIFRSLGLKVIFLDHGIREIKSYLYVMGVEMRTEKLTQKRKIRLPKKATLFLFLEAFKHIPRQKRKEILKLSVNIFKAQGRKILFEKILASGNSFSRIILYCINNLEVVGLSVKIEENKMFYTGFPPADKYFPLPTSNNSDFLVFIDHPYLETGMITVEQHHEMARGLEMLALEENIKIIIKLHPKTKPENWKQYKLNRLVQIEEGFPEPSFYLSAKMIFSFSSTMLVNFISKKKNIVLLSWHLKTEHLGNDFSQLGVCHLSTAVSDIKNNYAFWINNNLAEQRPDCYENFIREYNNPFDGLATQRVVQLITDKAMDK